MKNKIRPILFVVITLIAVLAAGYLDSVPNHRFGYGDYDLWLTITVFPLLFLVHGILAGVILNRFGSGWYFTLTPIAIFAVFAVNRFAIDQLSMGDGLKSAAAGVLMYFICSFAGMGLAQLAKRLIRILADRNKRLAKN